MVSSAASARNSRDDVVRAAARLFAERGYHGTSMRDLGAELGLFGSSLYSHVGSKQELLVEVVAAGAQLFQESAARAEDVEGGAEDRLRALVSGHLDVVLDNLDEVRTFLNEASALEPEYRDQVIAARDRYEDSFRHVLQQGIEEGVFRRTASIPSSVPSSSSPSSTPSSAGSGPMGPSTGAVWPMR